MLTKKGETDSIDLQRLGLFILAILLTIFLFLALSKGLSYGFQTK